MSNTYCEKKLKEDYPVYIGYCYVVAGVPIRSPVTGTVADLRKILQERGLIDPGDDIMSCDIVGRGILT